MEEKEKVLVKRTRTVIKKMEKCWPQGKNQLVAGGLVILSLEQIPEYLLRRHKGNIVVYVFSIEEGKYVETNIDRVDEEVIIDLIERLDRHLLDR